MIRIDESISPSPEFLRLSKEEQLKHRSRPWHFPREAAKKIRRNKSWKWNENIRICTTLG